MTPFAAERGPSGDRLVCRFGGETIMVEGCGPDGLRVRARPREGVLDPVWSVIDAGPTRVAIETGAERARITAGRLAAELSLERRYGADVSREVAIRFLRGDTGAELLREARPHFAGPGARSYRPIASDSFRIEASFAPHADERLYGLGQHHTPRLDLKGSSIRLLHQNTHTAIPFVISSRAYGFFWHNPAVGRADFATNLTRWSAEASVQLDYWVCAGDDAREVLRRYVDLTGHAPEPPDWITGFWQSKLRYRTQEELVEVAREHHRRGHPLSCIVIDFFHWTRHGEWRFDPAEWPDPARLVADLAEIGVEPIVSIWPTVSPHAETWGEMRNRGLLMRTESGAPVMTPYPDKDPKGIHHLTYYDPTLEAARDFLWDRVRSGYLAHGIRNFWLDSCEPEIRPIHPENLRLSIGNGAEVLNAYPLYHEAGFRKGLAEAGHPKGVLLCRSAWAGSQRHGVVLWSGDIWSTWEYLRADLRAGLSAGLSGLAWWSTDIGGFYDGVGRDPGFRELLLRWFQLAVFVPVCRLHGFRVPDELPLPADGRPSYGATPSEIFTSSGGANEIWSYGEELYALLSDLLRLRERLRPYLREAFAENARSGDPIMRPLFYDFGDDADAWTVEDSFMCGPDLLVAPVVHPGAGEREVYLPAGETWRAPGGAVVEGGRRVVVGVGRETIPVFARTAEALDLIAIAPPPQSLREA